MTEAELDPTVIKRTQETLGKYVKKPPLSEKLLKKPPFRFLHDVFKVVIKETGCFEGLYTTDELNFENIKDRDDKMRFLQKMIDVIKITTKRELKTRTSKIVAGYEAERTNELLQLMAEVIEQQMDWKSAVQAVVSGGGGGSADVGEKDAIKTQDKEIKKKDSKSDEKQREKLKEKSSKANTKDGKSKATTAAAAKSSGSSKNVTPSPDEKAKKSTKMAVKDKEKPTLSRQATIEKVSKEVKGEKEKVAKKSKESTDKTKSKTKDEQRKRTSPSPVKALAKNEQKPDSLENGKETKLKPKEAKLENGTMSLQKHEVTATPPRKLSKQDSTESPAAGERRGSKQAEAVEPKVAEKNENLLKGEKENTDVADAAGSRRASASQSRRNSTSGKSRHMSGSTKREPEPTQTTEQQVASFNTPLESLKSSPSLKTVNEEALNAGLKSATELQSIPQPTAAPPPTRDTRREPTFTHENSRDSVGSNSNSSNTARPRTSLRPPSARPPSARPGAPRRRDKNVEIILQPNEQAKFSGINVKLESFGDLDDDGENLVIIEDATTATADSEVLGKSDIQKYILSGSELEQQGHLVQQILETQKELVQQNGELVGMKTDKDNLESANDFNARQSSARQMNNLRDIIQSLTKSVNPFGKLMDFIPEDIDAMQLEFNMWRDTYTQAASDLKRERSLTESATEPMKNQLTQVEANIKEYAEMIDASRVKILQNSDKILKMLLEQ